MPPVYSKVSVPRALFQRIDALVEAHPEWGYRSASDVLTDLGRRWAEEKEKSDADELQKHVRELDRLATEREQQR